MIASHYAEPVARSLVRPAPLRAAPSNEAEVVRELGAGEPFSLLDDSLGWAWGYAGVDRVVGYIPSAALARD